MIETAPVPLIDWLRGQHLYDFTRDQLANEVAVMRRLGAVEVGGDLDEALKQLAEERRKPVKPKKQGTFFDE